MIDRDTSFHIAFSRNIFASYTFDGFSSVRMNNNELTKALDIIGRFAHGDHMVLGRFLRI